MPKAEGGISPRGANLPHMHLIAYADGASRGNPGPAAYGAVLCDLDGEELDAWGNPIGRATNNVAEYHGAIAAVEAALERGATELELRLDSELIVRQLEGRYRVKNKQLKPLFDQLSALIDRLDSFQPTHVRRHLNQRADAMANEALDR
ncbi:MAG: ribonuclease HI family protein [Chloroflexi bacterium]|nr:ribonuclease HI family protein [Chloroflexota bacterium]